MNRTDRWYGSSAYRSEGQAAVMSRPEARPETRPVFMVNPSIIVTLNDDMADELVTYLRSTMTENNVPSSVYALMRQLEKDLANARS